MSHSNKIILDKFENAIYSLLDNEERKLYVKLVNLGDTVYMPVRWERLVIPCKVIELNNVYQHADHSKSIWRYIEKDRDELNVENDAVNEFGWPGYDTFIWADYPDKDKLQQVNQFVWVDEYVGHAVQVGYDVFLSPNEALKYVPPSKKKHLKRRLKSYRNYTQAFIAGTWEKDGEKHPGFVKLPEKKILVRR